MGKTVRPLRNLTFHYPSDEEVRESLKAMTEWDSRRPGTQAEPYFHFAHQVRSQCATKHFHELGGLDQVINQVSDLINDYVAFGSKAVKHYFHWCGRGQYEATWR